MARIALGIIILYNYIIIYFQKESLMGPYGIPSDDSFTIYTLIPNNIYYFEIIYHLGILFSILFIIGYKGKIVSIFNCILTISFINRNYLLSDGGDNLMILLLFYLLFADVTRYFSIDSYNKNKVDNDFSVMLHNFAIYACIIQICIVYISSALYQLQGTKWSNGTALYYITQVDLFSNPHLAGVFHSSILIGTFLTYFSILIKIAFPFLINNSKTKILIVTLIVSFHIGIAVFMGLLTFALTMIAAELLIFKDTEYFRLAKKLEGLKNKLLKLKANRTEEGT
jgi:antimicrobial peptide system SdpB family protein